ncbi:MAG: hypothetical protein ACYCSN_19210 [Acidobacteriaceae bacterium]
MWLQSDDGFVYPLLNTLVVVTLGSVLLLVLLWVGSAMAGYQALQNAATSASFAGQGQVGQTPQSTQSSISGATGYGAGALAQTSVAAAAQSIWNQEVQNLKLNQNFTNLVMTVALQNGQVIVTATGDYQPNFLQNISRVYPAFPAPAITMAVTASQNYAAP